MDLNAAPISSDSGSPPAAARPPATDLLLALASLATRANDANVALTEILDLIASALGADSGTIGLVNPDSGKLETEARYALPPDSDPPLALGQGIPGWVAWHGKALLASDTSVEPRYRAGRTGIRCQMAAPMLAADGQVLGVVTLDRDEAGAFGRADLDLLAALTDEATRVMNLLWQLGNLRGKARQLETLLTTGQSFVSKLAPQELFDTLTRDTRHMMQARACGLYLFTPETASVHLASFAGGGAAAPPVGDLPLASCLLAAAIHTRRSVVFFDIQSPEFLDLVDLPRDNELRSVLATPVTYEGDVLGVLAVFLDRIHRFDNDEKRLCAALASLGAVALQNARLYSRVFESEDSLRKNERLTMLGLLSAEIAHEIRNPLTVLKLLHGGLGVDFPENDPRRTDLRVISEKLDQLEAIVTRVLIFGQAPTSLHTRCGLIEIVEDTLVLVRLKFAQSNIRVHFNRPARPLVVEGHKGQLQQVLLNLLINATHAMPDGGEITLDLKAVSAGPILLAALEVADTGSGVPEAIRSRIFDSFLSGHPDGTGLGLAIAKRVLLSHRGDLALVSTSAQGTTFRITLPLA